MNHTDALSKRRVIGPAVTRHRLARLVRWQPGLTEVPVGRLLLGRQSHMSATDFATATDDLLWSSRPVVDGPHTRLLDEARIRRLSDDDILASDYGRMAAASILHTGRYFAATDPSGIVAEARHFLTQATGSRRGSPLGPHHSPSGIPILAARIAHSDCYQVLDGHHRIALAAAAGEELVPVRVRRGTATTALQDLLGRMSWLDGSRELYQPVSAPELDGGWTTVRRCTDRLSAMRALLDELGISSGSYLDVASCYGWFVDQFETQGFDAQGIEADSLAPVLGRAVYGLDPARILVGDAVEHLAAATRPRDVVSCFSLLHHFVLGRGSCTPAELLRLLDRVTGRVLFLDTGQEDEEWFRRALRGWNPAYIQEFLTAHTRFDRIIDLGPDEDSVVPYEGNYGRHLFACVRRS